jgi:hypothetical protein
MRLLSGVAHGVIFLELTRHHCKIPLYTLSTKGSVHFASSYCTVHRSATLGADIGSTLPVVVTVLLFCRGWTRIDHFPTTGILINGAY